MTISFTRPTLTLSNNSTTVAPVDVILNDAQDFWVAPNSNPSREDGLPLPLHPLHPNPFSIVNCRPYWIIFRIGSLTMNQNAIGEWHSTFNDRNALVLPMMTANNIPRNLTFDVICTEHSMVARSFALSHGHKADAIAFVASAVLNFAISLITFRIFKQPKTID